jgi:hypothetical protein
MYPGTYPEYLWSKDHAGAAGPAGAAVAAGAGAARATRTRRSAGRTAPPTTPEVDYDARKRAAAEQRKREKAYKVLSGRIAELEARISECERSIKDLESSMATPGFYDHRDQAQAIVDRHQALMWQVGDLLNQWEMLQTEASGFADLKT